MKGLGTSIAGTVVALLVIALAAAAVAFGWRRGSQIQSPL